MRRGVLGGRRRAAADTLHRWGVRSDHAHLGAAAALGASLVCRIFSRKERGSGWSGLFGSAVPVLLLVGLGLRDQE